MTRSRQTADWGSRAGLAKIVPSSVAVGSGTGSSDALGNVSFTGCSSISLNGIFNSTYDNYRIVCDFQALSSNSDTSFRVRASGTDLTTSTYYWGRIFVGAYAGVPLGSENNSLGSSINIGSSNTTLGVGGNMDIDIHSPMLARRTTIKQWSVGNGLSVTGGIVDNTTAYDGITIFLSGQNITGTIRVYGYTQ
jgi:hypothetical protein